jgi:hypothetical protein
VTGHLIVHPIKLPSWLSDKKPLPFSHPGRAKKTNERDRVFFGNLTSVEM